VAEIEKQFTRLEAGVAALRRVQANLKPYRAAVLKAACEGRLVPTEAALARSPRSTKHGPPAYETGEALLARILTENPTDPATLRVEGPNGEDFTPVLMTAWGGILPDVEAAG
jgi:type I restriction enzyme S subunit